MNPESPVEPGLQESATGSLDVEGELPSGFLSGPLQDIDRDGFLSGKEASLLGAGLGAGSGAYLFSDVDSSGLPDGWPKLDGVREMLNTNIESLSDVEGIDRIDSYEDFVDEIPSLLENAPELVGYSFDNFAHLSFSGAASNLLARTVDSLSDEYDPKKAALAGMAVVPLYVVFKEGWYEGGPGIGFDWDNTDVQGDIMMDLIGAIIGTYSYHKSQVGTEGYSPGKAGKIARKAGRMYGRLEQAFKQDLYSEEDLQYEELPDIPESLEEIEVSDGSDDIDYLMQRFAEDLDEEEYTGEEIGVEEEISEIEVPEPDYPEGPKVPSVWTENSGDAVV
jgi:hypothetical protein